MNHYDDVDRVVGAGVQAPWPGALYNRPVVIHSHARTGSLVRSVMPDQTLDGFSGNYCCMGSTDSFGLPLSGTDEASVGSTIAKGLLVGAAIAGMAFFFSR